MDLWGARDYDSRKQVDPESIWRRRCCNDPVLYFRVLRKFWGQGVGNKHTHTKRKRGRERHTQGLPEFNTQARYADLSDCTHTLSALGGRNVWALQLLSTGDQTNPDPRGGAGCIESHHLGDPAALESASLCESCCKSQRSLDGRVLMQEVSITSN